jgi:threonine/homoserine efflux transporter RhtA
MYPYRGAALGAWLSSATCATLLLNLKGPTRESERSLFQKLAVHYGKCLGVGLLFLYAAHGRY